MAAQDVIRILLPVPLHDGREHKQVIVAPTAPTGPCTLSKQLYTMAAQDVIRILLPVQLHDDREHKQVIPAPTAPTSPRIFLSKQLYYSSTR
jgi:hypothetical protein